MAIIPMRTILDAKTNIFTVSFGIKYFNTFVFFLAQQENQGGGERTREAEANGNPGPETSRLGRVHGRNEQKRRRGEEAKENPGPEAGGVGGVHHGVPMGPTE